MSNSHLQHYFCGVMDSRQSILFLIGGLDSGGVSKSILSLLNVIDRRKYKVSLLIGNTRGLFNDSVPEGVEVLSSDVMTALTSGVHGLGWLLRHGHVWLCLALLFKLAVGMVDKGRGGWLLAHLMPMVTREEYDLIVDYNGQHQLYYMIDRLKGHHKVTFFHSDYRCWPYYKSMDRRYFGLVEAVFTINPVSLDALKEVFPEHADKMRLMENICSPTVINKLAEGTTEEQRTHRYLLLTVGIVWKNKGSDLALEATRLLKERGVDFEWWFVGRVGSDLPYRQLIEKYGLSEQVKLLGERANPYPYFRQADVVVHLSRFEGKSIVLDEAKLLEKPVVVTRFSTVGDQFEDGVNATICDFDIPQIANAIEDLLTNTELRSRYCSYLHEHIADNSSEVNKIYELLK